MIVRSWGTVYIARERGVFFGDGRRRMKGKPPRLEGYDEVLMSCVSSMREKVASVGLRCAPRRAMYCRTSRVW